MSLTGTEVPATPQSPEPGSGSRLGWSAGQPAIYLEWGNPSTTPKRALGSEVRVLPELEVEVKVRKLYQRPAFIVSLILSLLAVGVGVALLLMSLFGGGTVKVSDLAAEVGTDNLKLSWSGDDVPYGLYAVSGADGPAADLSKFVVPGKQAFIPTWAGAYDEGTCFVVRSIAGFEKTEVSLDAATLEEQGAQRLCVADLG